MVADFVNDGVYIAVVSTCKAAETAFGPARSSLTTAKPSLPREIFDFASLRPRTRVL